METLMIGKKIFRQAVNINVEKSKVVLKITAWEFIKILLRTFCTKENNISSMILLNHSSKADTFAYAQPVRQWTNRMVTVSFWYVCKEILSLYISNTRYTNENTYPSLFLIFCYNFEEPNIAYFLPQNLFYHNMCYFNPNVKNWSHFVRIINVKGT